MLPNKFKAAIKPKDKSTKKQSKKLSLTKTKECRIPKEKFMETLTVVDDEVKGTRSRAERACSVPIHLISTNTRHSYKVMSYKLLEEARLCVLQRDWNNLAKILVMVRPSCQKEHILFFQVFVRYAMICLAHNPDKNLLDVFMQGVASCSGDLDKQRFINSLTSD